MITEGTGFDLTHIFETLITVIPVAVGFIWAIKSDTKVLRTRLDNVDSKIDKMDNVLVNLAQFDGRLNRLEDRQILSGTRLDELSKRVNDNIDGQLKAKNH